MLNETNPAAAAGEASFSLWCIYNMCQNTQAQIKKNCPIWQLMRTNWQLTTDNTSTQRLSSDKGAESFSISWRHAMLKSCFFCSEVVIWPPVTATVPCCLQQAPPFFRRQKFAQIRMVAHSASPVMLHWLQEVHDCDCILSQNHGTVRWGRFQLLWAVKCLERNRNNSKGLQRSVSQLKLTLPHTRPSKVRSCH